MMQVDLNFDSLLAQFPNWLDVVCASVYGCGRPLKVVAADLDMTSSELSRKLAANPADPVHFPLDRLPDLLRATGDVRPVYWLVESFLEDPARKQQRAMAELAILLPQISQLVALASAAAPKGRAA